MRNISAFRLRLVLLSLFILIALNFSTSVAQESVGGEVKPLVKVSNKKTWIHGSVMYQQKHIDWIELAIKSYEEGIPLEILLPSIFPPSGEEAAVDIEEGIEEVVKERVKLESGEIVEEDDDVLPSEAPAFYLKSILYFSPTNWTIWINNKKISYGNRYKGVKIIKVTDSKVVFLWQNNKLDYLFPEWKDYFFTLDDMRFASNNKNIVINLTNSDVSFILRPNQSLVTKGMEIIEGPAEAVLLTASKQPSGEAGVILESDGTIRLDMQRKNNDADNPLLRGHNPADGIEGMQRYMMQLNMLKSALDNAAGKRGNNE